MRTFLLGVVLWFTATPPSLCVQLLDEPFENERLHLRFQPPGGWHLAQAGMVEGESVEFWKYDEFGPRIQIDSFPYELPESATLEDAQSELAHALTSRFPNLEIIEEKILAQQEFPAIEVMATLDIGDTYYHVIQRCLFARGRLYIVTCASFEASFLQDLPVFRASLNSIEILGDIFEPDAGRAKTGHLVRSHTAGLFAVCLAICAFILRRVSLARMERSDKSS